jgi:hypothetical protein
VVHYLRGGSATAAYHEFEKGERILIVWVSLPERLGLQVNGINCNGTFAIYGRGIETDVLLRLADESCQVVETGSHAEGTVHHDPETEPSGP